MDWLNSLGDELVLHLLLSVASHHGASGLCAAAATCSRMVPLCEQAAEESCTAMRRRRRSGQTRPWRKVLSHMDSRGTVERGLLKHSRPVHCVTALMDGRAVSGGADSSVLVWDVDGGKAVPLVGHANRVNCAIQLTDGRVATGSEATPITKSCCILPS